jgi:hypothetical protein
MSLQFSPVRGGAKKKRKIAPRREKKKNSFCKRILVSHTNVNYIILLKCLASKTKRAQQVVGAGLAGPRRDRPAKLAGERGRKERGGKQKEGRECIEGRKEWRNGEVEMEGEKRGKRYSIEENELKEERDRKITHEGNKEWEGSEGRKT